MAVSAKIRKRKQRARARVLRQGGDLKVLKAIETMPPELAADSKMWISPPLLGEDRPRVNWDVGRATADLMEAHAKTYGVTLDEVLHEIGVQFCIARPHIYWAVKRAKIHITDN